jgi:hypothetical protein
MRRWPRPCSKGCCLCERVVHLAPVDLEGGERGGGGRWKERSCGLVVLDGEKGERRGELAWQTDEFHGADSGTADRQGETFVEGAVVSGRGRTSHGWGQDDVARGCRIAGRTMAHVRMLHQKYVHSLVFFCCGRYIYIPRTNGSYGRCLGRSFCSSDACMAIG